MLSFRQACTVFALVCAPSALALALPQGQSRTVSPAAEPVLLELFTSQGCSSCPPADRLAARMASDPALVVIARPVAYWDRLGWKDTLARESNADLQQAYAAAGLAGRNGAYTPQVVVSGRFGAVGSNEGDILRGLARFGPAATAAIRINDLGEKGYGIGLGGETAEPAELLLVSVTRKVNVGIDRGENGGRKVTYTNVLRDEAPIAMWEGGKASHLIVPAQLVVGGADRHALVLRVPDGGKVLAARWLD